MTEIANNVPDGISEFVLGTTADAYAYGLKWICLGMASKTIFLKNTDIANALKYKVLTLAYHNGIEYEEVAETSLAVGDIAQINMGYPYACVKVMVKSSLAGTPADYEIDYTGNKC